ncbi:MAG: D-hydroxyproline dehydrogenase subunit beta, partial [Baekduia sp.]|nr:D-hydroxyproline dehydrogenase subunit beta [Baekduia sp.]
AGRGAVVRPGTPVRHVLVGADGRARGVRLAGGEDVLAGAVVLAAGPWTGPLAGAAGVPLPLEPRKGQLLQLRLPVPDERWLRHKVVDGSYLLSVASTGAGRQVSTVIETTWDGRLVVGSTRERCGFDASVDAGLEDAVRARAARLVPAVAGLARDAAWVGFRPWLPDHLPAIGPSARTPALWVATGHEGAGVALGPITGRVIAGAIAGEPPPMDLSPFGPDRFA